VGSGWAQKKTKRKRGRLKIEQMLEGVIYSGRRGQGRRATNKKRGPLASKDFLTKPLSPVRGKEGRLYQGRERIVHAL